MNSSLFVLIFSLQFFIPICLSAQLPPYVQVCKRNDPNLNKCFLKAVNALKPYLVKGIPEMDLPPGDPLYYRNITAKTGGAASVTLEGHVWNQVGNGLMDFDVKKIEVNMDAPQLNTTFVFPFVRLQGEYKLKGKVLLFEIDSQGRFDLNSTGVTCETQWKGKYYTKNGKRHIDFVGLDLKISTKKVVVYFSNLIGGNEQLTDTLNLAINENIDSLKEELHPIIASSFGEIGREYFNRVFKRFSVDQLFPED